MRLIKKRSLIAETIFISVFAILGALGLFFEPLAIFTFIGFPFYGIGGLYLLLTYIDLALGRYKLVDQLPPELEKQLQEEYEAYRAKWEEDDEADISSDDPAGLVLGYGSGSADIYSATGDK